MTPKTSCQGLTRTWNFYHADAVGGGGGGGGGGDADVTDDDAKSFPPETGWKRASKGVEPPPTVRRRIEYCQNHISFVLVGGIDNNSLSN